MNKGIVGHIDSGRERVKVRVWHTRIDVENSWISHWDRIIINGDGVGILLELWMKVTKGWIESIEVVIGVVEWDGVGEWDGVLKGIGVVHWGEGLVRLDEGVG